MDGIEAARSIDRIVDLLRSLHRKGVRVWADGGQLRYEGPKGALTADEVHQLRTSREQLLVLLQSASSGALVPTAVVHASSQYAPLTHTQLAHLNLYKLSGAQYDQRSIRLVAAAQHLHGNLNRPALERSLADVIQHHEALRTRIVWRETGPVQEVLSTVPCPLEWVDLSTLSAAQRDRHTSLQIDDLIMRPIDVAQAPLLGVRVLKITEQEHLLILAMEHAISDGTSLNIFLSDLFSAYVQTCQSRALTLPHVALQFPAFATWQRETHPAWWATHAPYWEERFADVTRLRFPNDRLAPERTSGWGTLTLRIDRDLKEELRQWCRLRQTTLVMGVFTAYVALVARWCGRQECVIQYQSNGRVSAVTDRTIGFFASVLYLRLQLHDGDRLIDLLRKATQEYCQAYEHADFSYLAAQVPRPDFTRGPIFNWSPQGSCAFDVSELDDSAEALTCAPARFKHPMLERLELDHEPGVTFYDMGEELTAELYFPRARFAEATFERFGASLLSFLRAIIYRPGARIGELPLHP